MYVRLVSFALPAGKESVAADLARDLVPEIRQLRHTYAAPLRTHGGVS
jgi:hypothetical protein